MNEARPLSNDLSRLQNETGFQYEITQIYEKTPLHVRGMVADIVKRASGALTDQFYSVMLDLPEARFYLTHTQVNERLRGAMKAWLTDLFRRDLVDPQRIVRRQVDVGAVHARIRVPIWLVARGFRELKQGLYSSLLPARLSREELVAANHFVSILLDLAVDTMTRAYIDRSERTARSDEVFRLFSLGHNLAAERERQRAGLAEWAQTLFFDVQLLPPSTEKKALAQSEFGLWFHHRASLLFGRTSEYEAIVLKIEEIDTLVLTLGNAKDAERLEIIRGIKQMLDEINALLTLQFDQCIQEETANDPTTRLINRRFVNTVIAGEIGIQKISRHPFSLVAFEIDRFAELRAQLGEAGADVIVQQTAMMLFNSARTCDTVFSMGRETFLIVRVESNVAQTTAFARDIADRYAATHFTVNGQSVLDCSLIFGVAEFDGHPDPRELVSRTQRALHLNKQQ